MAAIATIDSRYSQNDTTQATQRVRGTIDLSADYVTHGDTLPLNLYGVQSREAPLSVRIYEYPPAGSSPSGYILSYAPGTDASDGRIIVQETGAALSGPLAELAQGAYPAALTGATIKFEAEFEPFL